MRKIMFLLSLAFCLTTGNALASTTIAVPQHEHHGDHTNSQQPKLTPKQAAQKLAKELGLDGKQTKQLKKLNEQYAGLIANPRFKGKPMPADENEEIKLGGKPGGAPQSNESEEDIKLHIQQQRQKRNEYNAALQQILTKEQYTKYLGK